MTIREPTRATLKKYGLSLDEWARMLKDQDWRCPICSQAPQSGRFVIDHEHVKGWKTMKPEKRKSFVRGLLCWWCNHSYVGRGITIEKARGVLAYLEAYEERK